MSSPRYHDLKVSSVVTETADAKSFLFEVPDDLRDAFAYRPGQFLTVRVPVAGRHLPRCYSMSSVPGLDARLRVTVKRVSGGRASNWLCDHVKPGDRLAVMTPAGVFTPSSLSGNFVLCAGGSGITPILSILRSVLSQGRGRVSLLYANRDEASVIFRDELNVLAAAHPDRLRVIHWFDSVQGVPQVRQLAGLLRPSGLAEAFICGPGPFMDAAEAALGLLGFNRSSIHVERFVSLPEEGAAPPTAALPDGGIEGGGIEDAEIEVLIDGRTHIFRCRGTEPVLDAAQRAGLDLPYSCRSGLCASCICQVTEGAVHLAHNDVLDERDLAQSWTLSCQAIPRTARVKLRFR